MVVVRVMLASQSSRKRGASHIPRGTIHGCSKTAGVTRLRLYSHLYIQTGQELMEELLIDVISSGVTHVSYEADAAAVSHANRHL